MVEDEKYCIDILTQVSAMTKALQSVALGLQRQVEEGEYCLDNLHPVARQAEGAAAGGARLAEGTLGHGVVQGGVRGGPEGDQKVAQASEAIARLVRS